MMYVRCPGLSYLYTIIVTRVGYFGRFLGIHTFLSSVVLLHGVQRASMQAVEGSCVQFLSDHLESIYFPQSSSIDLSG